jgi:hypothetical protein
MRKAIGLSLVLAALLVSNSKAEAMSLYAGLLGGYGFTPEKHEVQPYGVGLGASAGLTIPVVPIYIGARLLWFIGSTDHISNPTPMATMTSAGTSVSLELSQSYLTYGVDLGYDAELGPLVLRPQLGIGRATLYSNLADPSGLKMKANDSTLYLSPALALLFKPGLLYVGAEVRYLGMTEKAHFSGVALLAQLGLTI